MVPEEETSGDLLPLVLQKSSKKIFRCENERELPPRKEDRKQRDLSRLKVRPEILAFLLLLVPITQLPIPTSALDRQTGQELNSTLKAIKSEDQSQVVTIIVNNTLPAESSAGNLPSVRSRREFNEQTQKTTFKPETPASENKAPKLSKPKLSRQSSKFLAQLKSRRKSIRASLAGSRKEQSANLTALASYKHEDWVPYSEPPATSGPQAAARKQQERADEDDDEPEADEDAEDGRRVEQENLTEQPEVRTTTSTTTTTTTTPAPQSLMIKGEHQEEGEERPMVSKSTTTTTTVGDGKKSARLSSKSGSLPPGLRRKIIEQFVKAGGDPQNIVISDSTITTTSQSKKKTITTVYKLVPDNQPKPMGLNGGEFVMPTFKSIPKGSPRWPINPKRPRNGRKLKKIMVTRTETLPEMPEAELTGEVTSGGQKSAELGEFYQGPQETIFGMKEQPEEFGLGQRNALKNWDKMILEDMGRVESPRVKKPPKEIQAELQLGGIGGGGISLKSLIEAIKPSLKIVKMMDEHTSNVAEHKAPNSSHLNNFRELKGEGKWPAKSRKSSSVSAPAGQSAEASPEVKGKARKKPEASNKRPKVTTSTQPPQIEQPGEAAQFEDELEEKPEPSSSQKPEEGVRKSAESKRAGSGSKLDSLEQLKRVVEGARQRSKERPGSNSVEEAPEEKQQKRQKARKTGNSNDESESKGKGSKSRLASSSNEEPKLSSSTSTTTTTSTTTSTTTTTPPPPSKGKTHNIMMVIDFSPAGQDFNPSLAKGERESRPDNSWSQSVGGPAQDRWQPVKAASSTGVGLRNEPSRPATVNVQIFNQQPANGREQLVEPSPSADYADAFDEELGLGPGSAAGASWPGGESAASQLHGHFHPPNRKEENRLRPLAETFGSDARALAGGQILPGESPDTNRLVRQVIEELAREPSASELVAGGGHFFTTTSVRDGADEETDEPAGREQKQAKEEQGDLDTSSSSRRQTLEEAFPGRRRGPIISK